MYIPNIVNYYFDCGWKRNHSVSNALQGRDRPETFQ